MSTSYTVEVGAYAERHFISKFKKKYKGAWDITWSAMIEEFKRLETLIGVTNYVEIITRDEAVLICKTEFRIAKTEQSRHSSGNRCIIACNAETRVVTVLLVYGKGDISGPHETIWWQHLVKEHYPAYVRYF